MTSTAAGHRLADLDPLRQSVACQLSVPSMTEDARENEEAVPNDTFKQHVHAIVLVHGWLGNEKEMGYIEESLRRQNRSSSSNSDPLAHRYVIHSASCNSGKTTDGIEAGGIRLANEIDELVSSIIQQEKTRSSAAAPILSLSLVGNSLGGLYARYALGHIQCFDEHSVQHAVFCTTATPHLGVSRNTWIPMPRFFEFFIGRVLLQTGKDLFCVTDVVDTLCKNSQYLEPLSKFQRRIAHANAFGTDFQVPTATAAFVTPNCRTLHAVGSADASKTDMPKEHVVTVKTKTTIQEDAEHSSDAMTQWAINLDNLGWDKVFWDVRSHLPSLPFFSRQQNENGLNEPGKVFTSEELFQTVTKAGGRSVLPLPFGHTVLVANSKNEYYKEWNRGGQPIMDEVAQTLLRDVVECS